MQIEIGKQLVIEGKYQIALEQALDWIEASYSPISIIVSGSIVRGNPDTNSDFDIYVVHEEAYRQRVQKFFNKVPCEIFINNLNHVRSYFQTELSQNRPVTANIISTGKLLKGGDDDRINEIVQEAKKYSSLAKKITAEQRTYKEYAIANLFEDATDVYQEKSPTGAYILDKVALEVIEFIFLTKGYALPRIKQRIEILSLIDVISGQLVRQYYQALDLETKYELVKDLLNHNNVNTGFFEWTSSKE